MKSRTTRSLVLLLASASFAAVSCGDLPTHPVEDAPPATPLSLDTVAARPTDAPRPLTVGKFAGSVNLVTGEMRVWAVQERGATIDANACLMNLQADGNPGTNPPNSIELYTDGGIRENEDCWYPESAFGAGEFGTARAICGDVLIRNFYPRNLHRIWAKVDTVQPAGVTGYDIESPPSYDLDAVLTGGFGRWSYGDLAEAGEGRQNTVQWTLERPAGVTEFTFNGRVFAFEEEICGDDIDNDCDGDVDEDCSTPVGLGGECETSSECTAPNVCSNGHCSPPGYQYILGGTFTIGSPPGEPGRSLNENQEARTVSPFFMKATEVTQDEWIVAGFPNPSVNSDCGTCPVDHVLWWETLQFANNRSTAAGLAACYIPTGCSGVIGSTFLCSGVSLEAGATLPRDCEGYRLPTEAEWEYAYRAGTTTAFYNGGITSVFGSDPNLALIGWYSGNALESQSVSLKDPNSWGLFDMAGNVYEFVWDSGGTNHETGVGPDYATYLEGSDRRVRGGSFAEAPGMARAAARYFGPDHYRGPDFGFRLARSAFAP